HVLTVSILLLSGCSSNFQPPKIIDTAHPWVGVHYESDSSCPVHEETPHINPYTYNPMCEQKDGIAVGDCKSYYSVAMGLNGANSTSLKSEFIRMSKPATRHVSEIYERNLNRNALVEALLTTAREATATHQATLQAGQSAVNTMFGLFFAGTSATAPIAGGAAATALSAATTGIGLAKGTVSKEIYQEQVAGHINNLIEQIQEKKLLEIRKSLANKDVYEYSPDRGIADAVDYLESGAFYKGLELVSIEMATNVKGNKDFVDNTKGTLNLDEEIKSEKQACELVKNGDESQYYKEQCVIAKKREAETAKANSAAALEANTTDSKKTENLKKLAAQKECEAKNAEKAAAAKEGDASSKPVDCSQQNGGEK
ncbi:MAG: hypothetical protein WBI40_12680, partial [Methylococcaceae bacterium]